MLILNFEGCMPNFALTLLLHSSGAVFKLAREHPFIFITVDITKMLLYKEKVGVLGLCKVTSKPRGGAVQ